jgi:hypothetical protein
MTNKIEKPEWYPLPIYNKKITPEEWFYEIFKRVAFKNTLSLSNSSIHLLEASVKANLYLEKISENNLVEFLRTMIYPIPGKPIKPLSISDVFRLYGLIKKSNWYQNHPDKIIFESAVDTLTNGNELNQEQKIIFSKFFDTPWYTFHENSTNKVWNPLKDFTYLNGVPVSIDPGYAKEDTAKELKNLLSAWVGKLQDVSYKYDSWQTCNILAVFDLMMWFKIQNITCTKIALHKLIWPKGRISKKIDGLVNPDDDISLIIDLVDKVISSNVLRTLLLVCENRKCKNSK